ncbi:T3SS effector OspC family protein [Sodalis ligni]|nr:T3SS effector OspC family protein [Sodalis ligni]
MAKIFSNDYLFNRGISSGKNTTTEDEECLSNQDFVFLGVEFSADLSQAPLNTLHSNSDFGANAYLVEARFPYGYMTLTDHLHNHQVPPSTHEHQDFVQQFPQAKFEAFRLIHGERGVHDVPMYNSKDMRLALGLHLINFIRSSEDAVLRNSA